MSFRIDQLAVLNLATVGNSITAGSFVKSGGTSSQFLKADGSVDSSAYITGITSGMVITALGYTPVPNSRTLTINGTTYDLTADRSWTITAGVSSVTGSGSGISVSPTTGAVVISNTGVTSNVAGTGISVSGATGAVTITNTGVTSIVAGTAITISGATGAVTINNAGVTSLNGSTGALTGFATQAWVTSQGYITSASVGNGTLTLNVSGNGLSGSQTFTANQSTAATFTVTSNATTSATANTIAYRDSGGDLYARYFFGSYVNTSDNDETGITRFIIKNGDNYHRSATTTTAMTVIRGVASGTWGIDISGNSATTSQTNFTTLTLNSATVATQSWVSSQGYVTGGPFLPLAGGSMSGDIVFPNNSSVALRNTALDAGFRPDDIYGNMYLWNYSGGFYVDATAYYLRSASATLWMTITGSGTVEAMADMRAPIFYDSQNTTYYGDFAGTSNFNIVLAKGYTDPNYTRIYAPGGGFSVNNVPQSGSIKIKLPTAASYTNTMLSFTVQIYNYSTYTSRTIRVGGYTYFNTDWYNMFAYQIGDQGADDLNVRFGKDGTGACIWIGETSTSWSYPNIFVTDVQSGHSQPTSMVDGWSVSIVTSFDTVQSTLTAYKNINTGNYNSYSPTLTGGGASGTWSINITGSAGTLDGLDSTDFMRNYGMLNNTDQYVNFRVIRNSNSSSSNDGMYIGYGNTNGGITRIFGGGATSGELIKYSNYTYEPGSFRAPIFYDSDDTGYYADFNSTSNLAMRVRGGTLYGPNPTWGAYLQIGSNGNNSSYATICVTNGNIHIDPLNGYDLYLNHYYGGKIYFGSGGAAGGNYNHSNFSTAGNLNLGGGGGDASYRLQVSGTGYASSDFRSPIFYDSDNTAYYGNFASTSRMAYITMDQSTGAHNHMTYGGYFSGGDWQTLTNTEGQLNVVQVNNINGGGYSNQPPNVYTYGGVLSWRTLNHSFQLYASHTGDITFKTQWNNDNYSGWRRILHESNFNSWAPTLTGGGASGTWSINITGSAGSVDFNNLTNKTGGTGTYQTSGDFRAPIFYDSDNTGYYLDPNSTSYLRTIIAGYQGDPGGGVLRLYAGHGDSSIRIRASGLGSGNTPSMQWWVSEPGVTWDEGGFGYNVTNDGGSPGGFSRINTGWGQAYMRFTTNGSLIFYNTNTSGTRYENMSLNASNYVYVNNYLEAGSSLRAPIFYDSNNTSYYLDPNSTTSIRTVGSWRSDSSAWDGEFSGKIQYHSNHWYVQGADLFIYRNAGGSNVFTVNQSGDVITGGVIQGGSYFRNNAVTTNTVYYASTSEAFGNILSGVANSSRAAFFRADSTSGGASVWWGRKDGSNNSVPCGAIDATDGEFTHWTNTGGTTGGWTKRLTVNSNGLTVNAGNVYAPIYYDSDNTGYYMNPAGNSLVSSILYTGYILNNGSVADDDSFGIFWDSSVSTAYAIYREAGSWSYPYPDLRIAFHTGIKIGANASYEGVRFYTDYDMSSQVMSVNNGSDPLGGGNVYVNNSLQAGSSLRAPIFYDSNDTAYFGDFASRSMMNKIEVSRNGAYGSYLDADLIVGSGAADRRGYGQTGGSNIMLRSSAKSTITALDESQNLGQISYENLVWTIGEDIGWGNQTAVFPGTVLIGYSSPEFNEKVRINGGVTTYQAYTQSGTLSRVGNVSQLYTTTAGGAGYYGGITYTAFTGAHDNTFNGSVTIPNSVGVGGINATTAIRFGAANVTVTMTQSGSFRSYDGISSGIAPSATATGGSISHVSAFHALAPYYVGGNTPTITNYFGLLLNDSAEYSSYVAITNRWGIYQHGSGDNNYFNGKMLLGTTTATSDRLYVNGSTYVNGAIYATGDVTAFSDIRLKENVKTVENALDKVTKLRGVTYVNKNSGDKAQKLGVIAQEVLDVLPEVISTGSDGFYSVAYGNIVGVLIEAIKEQQKQIDELKARLD